MSLASLDETDTDLETPSSPSASEAAIMETDIEQLDGEDFPIEAAPDSGIESPAEPACEKCHTKLVGKQGWCRRCGWYPRLGTFVELDPWDLENAAQLADEKRHWSERLGPAWVWKLFGGVMAIFAISLAARFAIPHQGGYRFLWTVTQMFIGYIAFCAGHLMCYLYAITFNDRLQPLDIILKPFVVWGTVLRELPSTFWRVATGTWGYAAVLGGLLVGGLADKDLLDWGGKPARYNLTKAIAQRAQQLAADADNDKNLEQSIEEFAGKAGEPKAKTDDEAKSQKLPVDCLILGYEAVGTDDFSSLILAADVGGKLVVVGTVSEGITPEVRAQLIKQMRPLRQPNPFIPCKLDGKWLRPEILCRIKAKRWTDDHRLVAPIFSELLIDVGLQ